MTNLFKRFFTHKSKFLLIILCLLGMVFSYSCSCRDNPYEPPPPTPTPSGNSNAFIPIANKIYNATNSSLIASEDGTTKTEIKIKFKEDNAHNIKNAKLIKTADTNGIEVTGASYDFGNSSFGFTADDLKTMLDKMDSKTAPATNILTLTFEVTTDDTTTTNTKATVEDVKVEIIKTQKFGDDANIIKKIIEGLGNNITAGKRVQFDFTKGAELDRIELENKDTSGREGTDNNAAEFLDDIINGNNTAIKKNTDYKKYFDEVKESIIGEVDGNSTKLNFKLTFTPKNIYDMTLLTYTIKLENGSGGKWNK